MKYFRLEEFLCKCGCGQGADKMYKGFLPMLDGLRQHVGVPFYLTSAYRCEKHNKDVGGSPRSKHLEGLAVDISTERFTALQKHQLLEMAFPTFNGIGVAKSFIHLDDREGPPAFWVY